MIDQSVPDPVAAALDGALCDVVRTLVRAVGLPPETDGGPRLPANGVAPTVHRDRVPAGPFALACAILDATGLALAYLREAPNDAVTLEEGLAYLTAPAC